jgi:hypothetical protein
VEQRYDHRGSGRLEMREEGDRALKSKDKGCLTNRTVEGDCGLGGVPLFGDDPTMDGHEGTPERTQGSGTRAKSVEDDWNDGDDGIPGPTSTDVLAEELD